jgi:Domain of unknown function (DUF4956)
MSSGDYAHLLLRLFIDGCALGFLSLLVARRRPRRGLFMVYATFNLGLFVVLTVISARHVGPAIGFGLFAMLSIVRLRSEPIGNAELAYFFCALVLALVNGLPVKDEPLIIGLNVLVLLTLTFVDHPALYRRTARQRVVLDMVASSPAELRAELERRLGVEIVDVTVEEIDFVREITRASVRHLQPHGVPEPEPALEVAR